MTIMGLSASAPHASGKTGVSLALLSIRPVGSRSSDSFGPGGLKESGYCSDYPGKESRKLAQGFTRPGRAGSHGH